MEPIQIDIAAASPDELRVECGRLGITGLTPRTRPDTLRKKLRKYQQDRRLHEEWAYLLQLLPGGNGVAVPEGVEAVMDAVCDLLYSILLHANRVLLSAAFDDEGKVKLDETTFSDYKPIVDFAKPQSFYILRRQNTRVVDTTAGGYSVIHAAQCAFPIVRHTFEEWERWRKAGQRGSR